MLPVELMNPRKLSEQPAPLGVVLLPQPYSDPEILWKSFRFTHAAMVFSAVLPEVPIGARTKSANPSTDSAPPMAPVVQSGDPMYCPWWPLPELS